MKAYSVEELRALNAASTDEELQIWQFFLGTGFREDEVTHACDTDVDFKMKTITVLEKRQWNRVKSCGCLRLEFLAIGRRAANARVPVAVPITYPIPPNTDPIMARRYQWRWERVEREVESELRLGRRRKEHKTKFTENNGKKIVPIDLIALAERKWRQAISSRILPITEVPSSSRLGSSVADRIRIVTTDEFERL